MPEKQPKVYAAIAAVAAELAEQGIAKEQVNQGQHYNFRGIDDVLNALAPLLAKHKLLILPRMVSRECVEHDTKSGGGTLFRVTVRGEFDFVSAEDASKHTVAMYGEAMDTGDKATNKAMSAAYKYAAFQAFCIPVDVEDADRSTPPPVKPSAEIPPDAYDPRGREPEEHEPGRDPLAGQERPFAPPPPKPAAPPSQCISEKQRKMLFAVLCIGIPKGSAGKDERDSATENLKAVLFAEGIDGTARIPKPRFNGILARLPECNAKCKARVAELMKEKRR